MPISQNTYTVPNNFVQQYDLGQHKIRADLVDENFTDAAGAINTLLTDDANTVHLTGAETVSGNKTFSGDNTFTGSVDLSSATLSSDATFSGDVTFTGDVDLSNANVEGADFVPVGTILWSANATVPAGYLLCNGSAVGRTTYPELFSAIGTAFGSGDGSTTFNLPNLIDKFIEGGNSAGTVKAAGLPNITGTNNYSYRVGSDNLTTITGAFENKGVSTGGSTGGGGTLALNYYSFDASRSSSIYQNDCTTVQPPAVTCLPCIKAFAAVIGDATVVAGQLVSEIQSKVALDGSNTASIGSTLSTYMAHAAMPSGQYVDLTLPASGGTVTAPADGWICLVGQTTTALGNIRLRTNNLSFGSIAVANGGIYIPCTISVSKNDVVTVEWDAVTVSTFRFFYANGSAS